MILVPFITHYHHFQALNKNRVPCFSLSALNEQEKQRVDATIEINWVPLFSSPQPQQPPLTQETESTMQQRRKRDRGQKGLEWDVGWPWF